MADRSIENEIQHRILPQLRCDSSDARREGVASLKQLLAEEEFITEQRKAFEKRYVPVLNLLRDVSDAVREETVACIKHLYIIFLPHDEWYLQHLIPILGERIGHGVEGERSEKIRVELLTLLNSVIAAYSDSLAPFTGDLIDIIVDAMADQNDIITQICLTIITDLTKTCPDQINAMGRKLVQPLLVSVRHKFHRIRRAAVSTIGDFVMSSGHECLEEIVNALRGCVVDEKSKVRTIVTLIAERWLREHPNNYSHCYLILPLLLPALMDPLPQNRKRAKKLWGRIGEKFSEENWEEVIEYYNTLNNYRIYPAQRPTVGCRIMVQRSISMMLPKMYEALVCDNLNLRIHCAKLLYISLLHVENNNMEHLSMIIQQLFSAVEDENRTVQLNILGCAKALACVIPTNDLLPIILPSLDENCNNGHLKILLKIIKSVPRPISSDDLLSIASTLATPKICQTHNVDMREELVNCTVALQKLYHPLVDRIKFSECIFNIIVSIVSIKAGFKVYRIDLLKRLKRVVRLDDLWGLHTPQLLNRIDSDHKTWDEDNDEYCIFYTILTQARGVLRNNFAKIVYILRCVLDYDVSAICRVKTLLRFTRALALNQTAFEDATEDVKEFLPILIRECFVPLLMWKPGPTEEQLRRVATICLETVLAQGQFIALFKTQEEMLEILEILMPIMEHLLGDTNSTTRYLALKNLVHIKNNLVAKNKWTASELIQLYPAILKMFSDSEYKVALYACNAMQCILTHLPATFREAVNSNHHQFIVDALFVHLDHINASIAANVLDILKVCTNINFQILRETAEKKMNYVCNKEACKKLMEHIEKS